MNHLAAVKEHSRSAADQDVPPPHELRPPQVLSNTMDFLMCNIMDRIDNMKGTLEDWFQFIDQLSLGGCLPTDPWSQFYVDNSSRTEETVGDWYEYMWSVTRAIRKDITQQNLKDLLSMSIVEKCARFHIFCAERLCEESAHNFDKKLNDENLTKCLRTLKHMLEDLHEAGIECPHEAEIRTYDILMNLNEGDTLREIQNYSDEVQRHPRVQFALQCFKVLESNNYVRFFKCVREATYLEACILKRYFYQVRRKAMETILRAYVPGKSMIQFPVTKISNWLAFEDETECERFFRLHGIESEDGIFFLERASLMYPENPPPMTRSRILIESKKTVSYGEIVNGKPLGENPYLEYYPHDSFDDNGLLKVESYEAKDQVAPEATNDSQESEIDEETRMVFAEVAQEMFEEVADEVVDEESEKACSKVLKDYKNELLSYEIEKNIEHDVLEKLIDEVSKEVVKKAKNDLIAQRLLEEEKAQEQLDKCSKIVDDLIKELVIEVSVEEMKEVDRQKKLQKYLKQASPICDDLTTDVLKEEIEIVAKQVIEDLIKEKAAKEKLFISNRKLRLTRKIFKEWRNFANRSKRQRAAILNFPSSAASLTSEQQNSR